MDIILNVLNNPVVTGVGGVLFGALGLGNWIAGFWRKSSYKKALNEGQENVGNLSALRLHDVIGNIIKDEAIKNEVIKEFQDAPDNFNKGWDRGLKGLKIGTPEYDAYIPQ